jgi:YggT family protein
MNPTLIILNFLSLYSTLVFIRCLLTWFPSIDMTKQPFMFLGEIVDPYLNLFRSVIPPIGGLDLSPMVALLLLQFAPQLLMGVLGPVMGGLGGGLM